MGPAKNIDAPEKVGGLAFFLSFAAVFILAAAALIVLPEIFAKARSLTGWLWFGGGCLAGVFFSHNFIRGKFAVLLHEFKHSILSNLVGNKWKSLKVKNRSGHFEYAYSKESARYNAFIALAPYWLPLFTLLGLGIGYAALYPRHDWIAALCGVAFGADAALNIRDISPHQTDLSDIRGGFRVALLYIIALNLLLAAVLAAWVTDGPAGLRNMGTGFGRIGAQILRPAAPSAS